MWGVFLITVVSVVIAFAVVVFWFIFVATEIIIFASWGPLLVLFGDVVAVLNVPLFVVSILQQVVAC